MPSFWRFSFCWRFNSFFFPTSLFQQDFAFSTVFKNFPDDLWNPGLHLQGLDQISSHKWLPGLHCPLQVWPGDYHNQILPACVPFLKQMWSYWTLIGFIPETTLTNRIWLIGSKRVGCSVVGSKDQRSHLVYFLTFFNLHFRTGTRTFTSTAAAKRLVHVKRAASHSGFHLSLLWTFLPIVNMIYIYISYMILTFEFSCCKPKDNELIKNKQCGYDVRKQDYVSTIHFGKK